MRGQVKSRPFVLFIICVGLLSATACSQLAVLLAEKFSPDQAGFTYAHAPWAGCREDDVRG
jgi:hypothetical protein